MNKLPNAKTDNLVVQNLNDEILIYNLVTNKAFCLNKTSAIVYQNCDGKTTFAELKNKSSFTEDLIHLTISELEKQGFVEIPNEYVSTLNGMTRREAVKKVGLATMIALPIISSVIAPQAMNAASGGLPLYSACSSNSDCTSDNCRPIFIGGTGNYCCRTGYLVAFALPNGNLCTDGQSTCNFRCCSGSGSEDPTYASNCGGSNSFPCKCN